MIIVNTDTPREDLKYPPVPEKPSKEGARPPQVRLSYRMSCICADANLDLGGSPPPSSTSLFPASWTQSRPARTLPPTSPYVSLPTPEPADRQPL